MGQRSQFYVQFVAQAENKEREQEQKLGLSAMHLQWSWGWFSIQRAKQLLDFIQKETMNKYSMFKGSGIEKPKDIREALYGLTQLNLNSGSYVKGVDLVYWELENKFTKIFEESMGLDYKTALVQAENYIRNDYVSHVELKSVYGDAIKSKTYTPKDKDKIYNINPFNQDNNDGIVVIQVGENGTIKYAFDLLQTNHYQPITAKEYYKEYAEYDKKQFDEEDKKEVQEMIDFVDSFELLTSEEMYNIFNQSYEW